MKERNKAVPASYLMLYDGSKILLGMRQNTGYMDGLWALPSGHIEKGELPFPAVWREEKEEIGSMCSTNQRLAHVMYREACDETGDRVDFFFRADWNKQPIVNAEPEKCKEWAWFDVNALPGDTSPMIEFVIGCVQNKVFYSELNAEWFKGCGMYFLND
jgi:8-oxo-dGTP diphosphatase